ncbi:hypothetical protein BJ170DRAFT_685301 [Xylariales sp. AK1849]|nr:hypothetical protein BJ170DRAFT_685301 [Xylariales sp. AK1849]
MCYTRVMNLACPSCGHPHSPPVSIPIICDAAAPVWGSCGNGLDDERQASMPVSAYIPYTAEARAPFNASRASLREAFSELRRLHGDQSQFYKHAIMEYALTCLYDPAEIARCTFLPETLREGFEGRIMQIESNCSLFLCFDHIKETLAETPPDETRSEVLQTLGQCLVSHECEPVDMAADAADVDFGVRVSVRDGAIGRGQSRRGALPGWSTPDAQQSLEEVEDYDDESDEDSELDVIGDCFNNQAQGNADAAHGRSASPLHSITVAFPALATNPPVIEDIIERLRRRIAPTVE